MKDGMELFSESFKLLPFFLFSKLAEQYYILERR